VKHIIACMLVAGSLAACNTREERTLGGGLIGAGGGALVGGLATGTTGGALAGAAIGGVGGAIIGNATTPSRRYSRRTCVGYDDYGNRVRVSC
jgi:osmotically inducible lipoprotein OsmB